MRDLKRQQQRTEEIRSKIQQIEKNTPDQLLSHKDFQESITKFKSLNKEEFEKSKIINSNINQLGLLKERGSDVEKSILDVIAAWKELGETIMQKDWHKEIKLPEFYYPKNITGLNPELKTFREPYSTYKGKSEEEVSIEASQVIASTNPFAAAKMMTLDEKGQRLYWEKVLRPILVNFYIATSKSKEEAISRFNQDIEGVDTISEIIKLIQKKIIWPIELEMKALEN